MTDAPPPAGQPFPPAQQTPAYAAPAAVVPGKTLGIVALILAFFFQLIALILGFVALSQSRKAGVKNTPALIAIILSIVFGILWIIGIIIGIAGFAALIEACEGLAPGQYPLEGGGTLTCG